MATTLTGKGQVTIPLHIRNALGLEAGTKVEFAVNQQGEVVLRRLDQAMPGERNRFEEVRGKADIKWRTDELMALLRGEG
ncbi:MAG: AbrB/MazE/SpoVT family DNA-binding domain-containing protein [Lautropia sp.]|nr:AbrB/MazE/SpoVT family DNA-binding domain-containing protein [Lautropia sp.]